MWTEKGSHMNSEAIEVRINQVDDLTGNSREEVLERKKTMY
jgi:hypothetical protein